MATTTPNFGWPVPTSTDLVKDGATAIEALGDSIDASLLDLKGGTSGQVLSKNSNTDMDFIWVTSDDANAIQNTIVDAKGDLITATAADTPARLAVGANNTILTADSSTATGLKWAAAATSGANWTLFNAGGTALTGAGVITVSGISGVDKIMMLIVGGSGSVGSGQARIRINGDTGSNYYGFGFAFTSNATYDPAAFVGYSLNGVADLTFARMSGNAGSVISGFGVLSGCNSSGVKQLQVGGGATDATGNQQSQRLATGYYNSSSTVSSVAVALDSGNWDAGTLFVYTSA
jgi:hypothetical protein